MTKDKRVASRNGREKIVGGVEYVDVFSMLGAQIYGAVLRFAGVI